MKAVLFDAGRVLVTWDPVAMLEGLADVSEADAATLRAILRDLSLPLGRGEIGARDFHRRLMGEAGATADWDRFFLAACQGLSRIEEGLACVREIAARPGVKVGVISNTNHLHAMWLRDHLSEFAAMDAVVLSPEAGLLKPDPAIYALALDRLEVDPEAAFFVDDIAENVTAAQSLGMGGQVHRDWRETRPAVEAWLVR